MNKKNMIRIFSAVVCLIFILGIFTVSSSANSAQKYFFGTDATGAIITGGECPIVVEREVLTFDIPEFPESYYGDAEGFADYSAKVTAEYTFYNPSENEITARLVFPFGTAPGYGVYDYDDTAKFDVTVNGAPIEKKIRYTPERYYSEFDIETDMALISDGFVNDAFYKPDMPVTKYNFRFTCNATSYDIRVALDVENRLGDYRIYIPEYMSYDHQMGGNMRISRHIGGGLVELTVYVIGSAPEGTLDWIFYESDAVDGNEIEGNVNILSTETMTFSELALENKPDDSLVSDIDWYNAVVTNLKAKQAEAPNHPIITGAVDATFDTDLMRWYEYEITLAPGERIVNAVTAPMYPAIDEDYEPSIYEYTYLLSPAKTWSAFGELEIIINTPYYITENTLGDFLGIDGGYTLTLDGLPDEELHFTLSESPNPEKQLSPYIFALIALIIYIIVIYALIVMAIIAILFIIFMLPQLIAGGIIALVLIKKKRDQK